MVEDLRDAIISEHCELVYVGTLYPRENRMGRIRLRWIECGPYLCHKDLGAFPNIDCGEKKNCYGDELNEHDKYYLSFLGK